MVKNITPQQRRAISALLIDHRKTIRIGRSSRTSGFGTNTPVVVISGDSGPVLCGLPYLKTNFSNGRGFTKTLYTPSTLHVTIGSESSLLS